jgi:ubiquitin-protein ligase
MSLRLTRLQNEYSRLCGLFGRHPRISVTAVGGDPPDRYRVTYMIRGLERHQDGRLIVRDRHVMEITLPVEYPRMPAMCRMTTPVFHPNIDTFSVCTSDFHAAQETLSDLIVRVGQMIAFQKHNVKSPLNAEAAVWCEQNLSRLPVDPSDLHPLEVNSAVGPSSSTPIRIGRPAP